MNFCHIFRLLNPQGVLKKIHTLQDHFPPSKKKILRKTFHTQIGLFFNNWLHNLQFFCIKIISLLFVSFNDENFWWFTKFSNLCLVGSHKKIIFVSLPKKGLKKCLALKERLCCCAFFLWGFILLKKNFFLVIGEWFLQNFPSLCENFSSDDYVRKYICEWTSKI